MIKIIKVIYINLQIRTAVQLALMNPWHSIHENLNSKKYDSGQPAILVQSVDVSMMHMPLDVRPAARTAEPSPDDGV